MPNRSATAIVVARRKADEADETHVGAPDAGRGLDRRGRRARRSRPATLLSIEAMKMETAIHAERDGQDRRGAGLDRHLIDAKDLLVVYA